MNRRHFSVHLLPIFFGFYSNSYIIWSVVLLPFPYHFAFSPDALIFTHDPFSCQQIVSTFSRNPAPTVAHFIEKVLSNGETNTPPALLWSFRFLSDWPSYCLTLDPFGLGLLPSLVDRQKVSLGSIDQFENAWPVETVQGCIQLQGCFTSFFPLLSRRPFLAPS